MQLLLLNTAGITSAVFNYLHKRKMEKLSFKQILNKESFDKIKRDFLIQDYIYGSIKHTEEALKITINESINDITVIYEKENIDDFELDSFGEPYNEKVKTSFNEKQVNFYNDYLYPIMKNRLDFFKQSFEEEIKIKAIYETTALQRFCSDKLRLLTDLVDNINNSHHLDSSFKIKIIEEIEKLYEYINTVHLSETLAIPERIPFKLSKNQVVVLFTLLHKKKIIVGIHPLELYRLIERFFTYYNVKENKFKEIIKSKKTGDELLNNKSTKSAESTLQSLEKIFSKKDFFIP